MRKESVKLLCEEKCCLNYHETVRHNHVTFANQLHTTVHIRYTLL